MASNILNFEVSTSQRELVDRYNIYTKQLQQANIKNIPLDCSKRNGFKIDDKSKSIKKKPAKRILNKFKYWNDGQDFSIVITDTSNDLDIEVLPSDYVQSVDWDDVDVESVELENNGDNNVEHGNSEINGDIIALNGIDTEKIIDDSTIDDNNNKNNDNDCEDGDKIKELEDTVVNVEQFSRSLYNFHYAKNRSLYISFDSTGSSDMRFLVGLFKDFDVVNDTEYTHPFPSDIRVSANLVDYRIIQQYLDAPEFNMNLLKNTTYDHVLNAIISYILLWDDDSMKGYMLKHPKHRKFLVAVIEARENGYVYDYKGVPYIKTPCKVLRKYFEPMCSMKHTFEWSNLIDYEFIRHLNHVYSLIITDSFDFESIKMLEADMPIPYKLPNIDINLVRSMSNQMDAFKFISGQACCCKTTIINKLTEMGWKKFSRGDVGSFSGKSSSPAAIGNLHAALDFVLRRPNVIGDRGYIDNIIWSYIMPKCKNVDNMLVYDMFSFFNANFNEPSIAQYISQKGLIFIDPYVKLNRERQMKRCESGDAHRARIYMYPIVQFMVYYTVARLFGWKVLCVPYDSDRNFDNQRYNENIEIVRQYFGHPAMDECIPLELTRFDKPENNYEIDNYYPKAVGIFK
ncbi:ACH96267.1 GrBNV gp17-like protein [Kallithea virus]|uniref:ACH96267.1 GrBNV gp17-like protein n=1 Tax=Kallithea virus TaxID=1654582 RepID=A0A1S5VG70_9VIRU|nr:ACH96267.1 GrBNV gp17-like protein [Kallithea virus]AQN78638.1 ACH96267.1 GrBNV gp17-like protein [Kallithea virus]